MKSQDFYSVLLYEKDGVENETNLTKLHMIYTVNFPVFYTWVVKNPEGIFLCQEQKFEKFKEFKRRNDRRKFLRSVIKISVFRNTLM